MSLTRARWRLSLTLLCLFASTFQSSLAQTHVHNTSPGAPFVASTVVEAADEAVSASSGDAHGAANSDDAKNHARNTRENASCPLCQILMFGGGLPPAPYQVPARPSVAATHVSLEQVPACFIAAVSYSWQSRGPPRV